MITQEQIRKLFKYNDGQLIRIVHVNCNAKKDDVVGCNQGKYLVVRIDTVLYLVHRVIFLLINGYLPENIDHIDGDKLNNKIENLRSSTTSQNGFNSKIRLDNKTGIKGVLWCKKNKVYIAKITTSKKVLIIGRYKNLCDAKKAIENERERLHKEFSNHG